MRIALLVTLFLGLSGCNFPCEEATKQLSEIRAVEIRLRQELELNKHRSPLRYCILNHAASDIRVLNAGAHFLYYIAREHFAESTTRCIRWQVVSDCNVTGGSHNPSHWGPGLCREVSRCVEMQKIYTPLEGHAEIIAAAKKLDHDRSELERACSLSPQNSDEIRSVFSAIQIDLKYLLEEAEFVKLFKAECE